MIVPVPLPLLAAAGGILIVAGGLGAWRINDAAYERAVVATDAKWRTADAKARADAQALAQARQTIRDDADALATVRSDAVLALAAAKRPEVHNFYAANPASNRSCLDPDRVRDIALSDAAAIAAARAARDRPATVLDPATVRRR